MWCNLLEQCYINAALLRDREPVKKLVHLSQSHRDYNVWRLQVFTDKKKPFGTFERCSGEILHMYLTRNRTQPIPVLSTEEDMSYARTIQFLQVFSQYSVPYFKSMKDLQLNSYSCSSN